MTRREKIDSLTARTKFQKTVKSVLLDMVGETETAPETESESKEVPALNFNDLESNYKRELVAFAEAQGIEVPEPQNKKEYIEAIQSYIES